jgi:hypothetical protein
MGIFGWSYPPGCSGPPDDDYDDHCQVCGQWADDCICPECPECSEFGRPACYQEHGLVRSAEQIDAKKKADEQYADTGRTLDEQTE